MLAPARPPPSKWVRRPLRSNQSSTWSSTTVTPRKPRNGCSPPPRSAPSTDAAQSSGPTPLVAAVPSTQRNAMTFSRTSSKRPDRRSSSRNCGTSTSRYSLESAWQKLWDTSLMVSSLTPHASAPKSNSLPHWKSSQVILSSILSTQSSSPQSKPLTPDQLTGTIRFICPACSVGHSLDFPLSSSTNTKTSTPLTMQCLHALSKGALLELAIHGRTSTDFVELRLTAWPKQKPSST